MKTLSSTQVLWFAALLTLCVEGWFFRRTIAPLRARLQELRSQSTGADVQLKKAREEIDRLHSLEQQVAAARVRAAGMEAQMPDESPMVWIAERLERHFARFGYPAPIVRFISSDQEPGLRGYQRMYWSIGLRWPSNERTLEKALLGIAALEQAEPLFKITDFSSLPDQEYPGERVAVATAVILVKE